MTVFGVQVASAAPPAPHNWAGFYAGGHLGYGWSAGTPGITGNALLLSALVTVGAIPSSLSADPKGWLAGVQAGYNFQVNKFVYGVEADFSLADIQGSNSVVRPGPILPFATYTTSVEQRMEWFGTLRGRLGVAATDQILLYGTGGLAFGRSNYGANIRRTAFLLNYNVPASPDVTRVGWTIGGGAEYALAGKWSVKAEYLYYDLGNVSTTGYLTIGPVVTATSATYSFATRGSIARVGFNYKIN